MTLDERAEAVVKRLGDRVYLSVQEVDRAMHEAAAIIRELLAERAEYVDVERMKLGKV